MYVRWPIVLLELDIMVVTDAHDCRCLHIRWWVLYSTFCRVSVEHLCISYSSVRVSVSPLCLVSGGVDHRPVRLCLDPPANECYLVGRILNKKF